MTWRHTHVWGSGECDGQSTDDPRMPCGCTTPTPDPASPCGQLVRCCHLYEMPCGTAKDDHGGIAHRHQPTRCTCGHPIERGTPPHPAPGGVAVSDPMRAALDEFFESQPESPDWPDVVWSAYENLQRAAAIAAASPETGRCACGDPREAPFHTDGLTIGVYHPFQPEPAAPSVEALRDALLADFGRLGLAHAPNGTLGRRLDALEAAARADERTRLAGGERLRDAVSRRDAGEAIRALDAMEPHP